MTDPSWRISPLAAQDCAELGRVHIQVWRETYAGQMPADYLAGLSAERSAANWLRGLQEAEPRDLEGATLVARDATDRILGFASAGPTRDEDAPTEWELYVINLVEGAHGTGLADELVGRVIGDRDASLWVVEANARARAFYTRHGFVPDGGRTAHEATGAPEVRLVRRS